jgi:hypothetical protein
LQVSRVMPRARKTDWSSGRRSFPFAGVETAAIVTHVELILNCETFTSDEFLKSKVTVKIVLVLNLLIRLLNVWNNIYFQLF